jgi:hypothetical protein
LVAGSGGHFYPGRLRVDCTRAGVFLSLGTRGCFDDRNLISAARVRGAAVADDAISLRRWPHAGNRQ